MILLRAAGVLCVLLGPTAALADPVLDWNAFALERVVASRQLAPDGARTMALVHVAMFDALNARERRYVAYAYDERADADVSAEAAAAAAAATVLGEIFPADAKLVEERLATARAALGGGAAVQDGLALGRAAARSCLARRANDGAGAAAPYRPRTTPAVYVPTSEPVGAQWTHVTPWLMRDPAAFRPAGPPALTSATWARDYEESRTLGGAASTARTAEQTEIARFWTVTGPASWNPVVRALVETSELDLLDRARLFALVGVAASDALVAVFDAKYAYEFWRPVTAIRNGDADGNDATQADPAWVPLVDTPLHPEYPCAHCITSAAVATVLEAHFGTDTVGTLKMTSASAPGVVRQWNRIGDYAREVGDARVWGGVHFRRSVEVGADMGRAIGRLVAERGLQPRRPAAGGT